jgi:starvation-inducible DNA-binding protein
MIKPTIGIDQNHLSECSTMLNTLLTYEYALYTKTLNYHWNVTGPYFGILHAFFKAQYEELFEIVDSVAERVTTLGQRALGTLKEFAQQTEINETIDQSLSAQAMIGDLLNNHESIIRSLRISAQKALDHYHDAGTNNFLIDLIEKHEKMAWMLRAHLEK